FLFFFSSYTPPRDLHSFPTRRSSDLERLQMNWMRLTSSVSPILIVLKIIAGGAFLFLGILFIFDHVRLFEGLALASISSAWIFLDRKSTRLNSSHLVISYAVFCLKKK